MYKPIQLPYLLNTEFAKHIKYAEKAADECGGFVICFWEMAPLSARRLTVENIITTDGCIDLVVNFDEQEIGFSGMNKTVFDFRLNLPVRFFGARMMPGAFHQLTGLPASAAMNTFLPIDAVYRDFDRKMLFSLPYPQAKDYFKAFLAAKTNGVAPGLFTRLFHTLSENIPSTTVQLAQMLHFSPRQCQRLLMKHYGLTPKMALCIMRFQNCLRLLTAPHATLSAIANAPNYYDQPHIINDFKRNMGITPRELLRSLEQFSKI